MMILFLLFFPLLTALLIMALKPVQAKVWALAVALIELTASLIMAFQFSPSAGTQFELDLLWMTSIGMNFSIGIDGISLLLVLLTTLLVPFIILSSFGNHYSKPSAFYGLILIMQMALIGVFIARDGLLFYLFWEIALIPIYFICLLWGGEDRGRITFKFFVYTLTGSLIMLIGLIYLYLHTPGEHSFALEALYQAGRSLSAPEQSMIFWAMFIAFAIKMPVFPFHTWQPDTYTVAPAQGTMLLSGIMLKMGIYGLIRWLIPIVPSGVQQWGTTAVTLAIIGIIYASCIALVQKDAKRLIAYASMAHVGLIAAGLMTLNPIGMQGAMVQMISHGILAVALFFLVDVIENRVKTRTLDALGGIRNVAPQLATAFIIVLLGTVALPLTSGFIGEFLLINALFQYHAILGSVAGLSIILGAVYMLVMFQKSMSGEVNALTTSFTDLTTAEKWVLYPIMVLILLIGLYPSPILNISEPTVQALLQSVSNATASAPL